MKNRIAYIIGIIVLICVACYFVMAIGNRLSPPKQQSAQAEAPATGTATLPVPTAETAVEPTTEVQPTDTPAPTATPLIMDGSGDGVVEIAVSDPVLLHIGGNAQGNFVVIAHNQGGQDLLVNTIGAYNGIRPLNFKDTVSRLEIKSDGAWHIELWPLLSGRKLAVPGEIKGRGDDVILIDGTPNTATISGNKAGQNFVVIGYGQSRADLLVNTIDAYQGTVVVDSGTLVLEVTAVGDWHMAIK